MVVSRASLLADAVLPRHFSLLVLGRCDYGLGDLARHRSRCRRRRRSTLGVQGVFFRDAALSEVGFGGQGGWRLVEVVERRVVGDVVWVEVVVVVVELRVRQPVLLLLLLLLLRVLWSSGGGRTRSLGLDLDSCLGRGDASRGGVAAAGRGFDPVQDFGLGDAVPDGLVERVQVFLVGGPGLAAGDGVQGVCATGRGVGGGGGPEVALTEGGDSGAGAARQGGVTAIQDGLWTGGRGRYRVQGRLQRERGGGHKETGESIHTCTIQLKRRMNTHLFSGAQIVGLSPENQLNMKLRGVCVKLKVTESPQLNISCVFKRTFEGAQCESYSLKKRTENRTRWKPDTILSALSLHNFLTSYSALTVLPSLEC